MKKKTKKCTLCGSTKDVKDNRCKDCRFKYLETFNYGRGRKKI